MTALNPSADTQAHEFLTFTLGPEEYGVEILKVQEIKGYGAVTRIANAPAFIKGVINLRGAIVPLVDMRIKFNLSEPTYDEFTVAIVLNIAGRIVGIIVDSVSDVISLTADEIKPSPEFSSSLDTRHILGLATQGNRMVILLDIEKLMTSEDMALIDTTAG